MPGPSGPFFTLQGALTPKPSQKISENELCFSISWYWVPAEGHSRALRLFPRGLQEDDNAAVTSLWDARALEMLHHEIVANTSGCGLLVSRRCH
jgi:hypothetical protein